MPTLYTIQPERGMDICPLCGSTMELNPPGAESHTQCRACEYMEPAGTAQYMAFITQAMVRIAKNMGIEIAHIQDKAVGMNTCLHSRGLLPLLVSRATSLVQSYGLSHYHLFDHGLFNQRDDEAVLNCRVTIREHANVNSIITTLLILTEVLEETLLLTRQLGDKYSADAICLDCIPGNFGLAEASKEPRFLTLLKEAAQQSQMQMGVAR